ncbi:GcrA family cell cycle regulator [Hyphomicrobium sp. ghe19]|uniref:GcrA family cell cycle regulator n=1 Tax=Hyphomicrobium sp. ghe19 TaxID=2682968 RepID=UPI001366FC6A|nr:hypothetical protein HYPP_02402 [Hyphomicrobium sp. ghe19]
MRKQYVFSGRHPKEEKVEALTAVYERGDRGLDIARKLTSLTKSKNAITAAAVIGFYNRNKQLLKDYPLTEPVMQKKSEPDEMKLRLKRRPEPSTHAPLPIRTEESIQLFKSEEVESLKIPLMKLKSRECRWGTHETVTDGHLFCGHQTKFGKSYCDFHTARSQQKTYKEMRAAEEQLKTPKMLMIEGPVAHGQA